MTSAGMRMLMVAMGRSFLDRFNRVLMRSRIVFLASAK